MILHLGGEHRGFAYLECRVLVGEDYGCLEVDGGE